MCWHVNVKEISLNYMRHMHGRQYKAQRTLGRYKLWPSSRPFWTGIFLPTQLLVQCTGILDEALSILFTPLNTFAEDFFKMLIENSCMHYTSKWNVFLTFSCCFRHLSLISCPNSHLSSVCYQGFLLRIINQKVLKPVLQGEWNNGSPSVTIIEQMITDDFAPFYNERYQKKIMDLIGQ